MLQKLFLIVIGMVVVSLALTPLSTSARETPISDYCADKATGKIQKISKGSCRINDLALGTSEIKRPQERPKTIIPKLTNRFEAAKAAAQEKGHTLAITSGYRSLERQEYLFDRAVKRHGSKAAASKWVLPPKKSNHPWGLAIDINYGVGGSKGKKAAAWLEKNGYKYGLCRRYENEWWHFEPLVAPGQKCPAMEPHPS
jgi:zinc D-Ala-D-Ala carboxypeptidase